MNRNAQVLIIGVGGCVVGIDPSTGSEIWRTKLKGGDTVTISVTERQVYAGTGGELFCLDAYDGTILWRNKLKGLGLGIIAFGTPGEGAVIGGFEEKNKHAAAVGAAT